MTKISGRALPRENRGAAIVAELMDGIRSVLAKYEVTYCEYTMAKEYLVNLGQAGEWPLFADVFFEATVEEADSNARDGSPGAIEGPFFLPGAPVLEPPFVMPMRAGEPGDVLVFSGTVTAPDRTPIPHAQVEIWQSDAQGTYSGIPYPDGRELPPEFNLRARLTADENGAYQVRTIVPVPYEIPTAGPTGALLTAVGWHAFRPAHLHLITSAPGFESLTTQLYFDTDPYLDSDIAGAVKPELVLGLEERTDLLPGERTCFAASYEFRLPRARK
ncbi:dioxygenase [Amycolatopsis jejuensis]|uniref:dioxygenase family protein n=1 Tax=Amycolatopsis jejuensis TaxID=330084 RepID=UPI000A487AAA|nr:dioxygenase [Amycolatopsis jejuensis]